ncbi:MAG: leucine-rich repeat domain-containing protein [Deltaproteobacteria bacterium]|jgi:hypothetical protein|nr:leucine-rich repeat domain-containing protein [Deltaproteobacteria bacterium]
MYRVSAKILNELGNAGRASDGVPSKVDDNYCLSILKYYSLIRDLLNTQDDKEVEVIGDEEIDAGFRYLYLLAPITSDMFDQFMVEQKKKGKPLDHPVLTTLDIENGNYGIFEGGRGQFELDIFLLMKKAAKFHLILNNNQKKLYYYGRGTLPGAILEDCLLSFTANTIEIIGDETFFRYKFLESISFNSAKIIGRHAFSCCPELSKIKLRNAVEISNTFGSEIGDDGGAFAYCDKISNVILPYATIIGNSAFRRCHNLRDVIIPRVETIEFLAFDDCLELININMQNVNTIEPYAFRCCEKLENVYLPNLISISEHAFRNCKNLKKITLPRSAFIEKNAFDNDEIIFDYFT